MSYSPQTLLRLVCTLLAVGLSEPAAAQELATPLAAMRKAAEEQADIDPAAPVVSDAQHLRRSTPKTVRTADAAPPISVESKTGNDAKTGSDAATLHSAMRAIARDEVAIDLAAAERASNRQALGTRKSQSGKNNPGEGEQEARERARGAAVQAQTAKAVGVQRSNGNSNGNGNGNGNGRSALSSGTARGR